MTVGSRRNGPETKLLLEIEGGEAAGIVVGHEGSTFPKTLVKP